MIANIVSLLIFLNCIIKIALVLDYNEESDTRKRFVSAEMRMRNLTPLRSKHPLSTPSYIEFYYLDNFHDSNSENKSIFRNIKTSVMDSKNSFKYKVALLRPPFFSFRSNKTICNITYGINKIRDKNKTIFRIDTTLYSPRGLGNMYYTPFSNLSKFNNNTYSHKTLCYIRKKENRNVSSQEYKNIERRIANDATDNFSRNVEYTTAYDRIKFFEMYDSDTYPPPSTPFKYKIDDLKNAYKNKQNEVNLRVAVNETVGGIDSSKYSKKHLIIDRINESFKEKNKNNFTVATKTTNQKEVSKISSLKFSYLSKPALWSDFPFVAVYTYEPAQVRCDCASISPHWLVSSAVCLYLHHRDSRVEERSAFVTYCGNNLRRPGRITYVKRSLLHPNFKPLDRTRRRLYNIGVIQVINSMANTCSGWHPIPIMSHQFLADHDGTLGTAVGWGLDRYDTSYISSELVLHSLMLYEGRVYSGSCPGNSDYSKARRLNEESIKNVHCLSLPTYINEENDTVHGSLLLVEGKLMALYLQEQRRSWGEQSAQYTGIWRLIPWLLDVAQEIDEHNPLEIEI